MGPDTAENGAARSNKDLPPGSKINRMSAHTKGLFEDLTEWVELRIKLAQVELEEKVEEKANAIAQGAVAGVLAALAGLFLLLTMAIGIGWLLGHPFWGFLIVTVLLGLGAAIIRTAKPTFLQIGTKSKRFDAKKVQRGKPVEESPSNNEK